MRDANIFKTVATIIEHHERAVIIAYGLPSRPVILPLSNIDFEPIAQTGFGEGATIYEFTMHRDIAKECGLTV